MPLLKSANPFCIEYKTKVIAITVNKMVIKRKLYKKFLFDKNPSKEKSFSFSNKFSILKLYVFLNVIKSNKKMTAKFIFYLPSSVYYMKTNFIFPYLRRFYHKELLFLLRGFLRFYNLCSLRLRRPSSRNNQCRYNI